MTNLFLQVNKDLFTLKLNPTEMLIVAQVMEFERNKCECYMTDAQFAENLSVSVSTISRAIRGLVDKNILTKDTVYLKGNGGRQRKIYVNYETINTLLSNCSEPLVNLLRASEQNDVIKDNVKDNSKDNFSRDFSANGRKEATPLSPSESETLRVSSSVKQKEEVDESEDYPIIKKTEVDKAPVEIIWLNENLIRIPNNNNKIFRVI